MSLHVVILAAGKGKRMKSSLPKVMHCVGGKPMVEHVLATSKKLKPDSIHVVAPKDCELIKNSLAAYPINWHIQEEQLGTADAVNIVLPGLPENEKMLILYADTPLIEEKMLSDFMSMKESDLNILTVMLDNPFGYGRIVRDKQNKKIDEIIEELDAKGAEKEIKECNTGIIYGDIKLVKDMIALVDNKNAKNEYYLTDIVKIASSKNLRVTPMVAENPDRVLGINDKSQLATSEKIYQRMCREELLNQGVTLTDPDSVIVRGSIDVEEDVEIDGNVILEGNISIGKSVKIQAHSILKDTTIDADTIVKPYTIIEDSKIGKSCTIGPYARIRPNCEIDKDVTIGNFVEVKASTIGEGTKAAHLSYLGDSEIGKEVNIGAGTITCNYDGFEKHKTIIGDNVFVGSNTELIAPLVVEEGVTIGAGSTITDDSPKDSLVIGRARQITKKNWKGSK